MHVAAKPAPNPAQAERQRPLSSNVMPRDTEWIRLWRSISDDSVEFEIAVRQFLQKEGRTLVSYAVKTWLPEIKAEFVTPESTSLADFLFDGNILDEPEGDSPSEAATIKVFTITVLSQRLDYLRILSARGYDVDQFEIENTEQRNRSRGRRTHTNTRERGITTASGKCESNFSWFL